MLSKSTDLDLSVLSMNQHYLELNTFLSEIVETDAALFSTQSMFLSLRNDFMALMPRSTIISSLTLMCTENSLPRLKPVVSSC